MGEIQRPKIAKTVKFVLEFIRISGLLPLYGKKRSTRILQTIFFCFLIFIHIFRLFLSLRTVKRLSEFAYGLNLIVHIITMFICVEVSKKLSDLERQGQNIALTFNKHYDKIKDSTGFCIAVGFIWVLMPTSVTVFEILYNVEKKYVDDNIIFGYDLNIIMQILDFHKILTDRLLTYILILLAKLFHLRLQLISKALSEKWDKVNDLKFWRDLRRDYIILENLARSFNNSLGKLMLLKYIHLGYQILSQFYVLLLNNPNETKKYIFIYSALQLLTKLTFLTLCCSWVSEENTKIIEYLTLVPAEQYNVEIHLLEKMLKLNQIYINASKNYRITRGNLINIAELLLNYSLIIWQVFEW